MIEPYYETDNGKLYNSDSLEVLKSMGDGIVQCIVTSPPYWGLRDYGTAEWEGGSVDCEHKGPPAASESSLLGSGPGKRSKVREEGFVPFRSICGKCGAARIDKQLGLEETPEEYIDKMVQIFREVRRVMRDDATLWLNMGDCYAGSNASQGGDGSTGGLSRDGRAESTRLAGHKRLQERLIAQKIQTKMAPGLKPKDLVGMPWRLAFALQADGWYLRSDIIWSKPNPMPESCTDRPTKAHEYVFLMTKQAKYYYDADAVREKQKEWREGHNVSHDVDYYQEEDKGVHRWVPKEYHYNPMGRNRRTVWTIPTQPYSEAHFATFPTKLVIPCIKAGTSEKGNCSVCGKPWLRVVECDYEYGGERKTHEKYNGKNAGFGTNPGMGRARARANTRGWQPSCTCNADIVKPIVCDPFMGSGTVAEVCERYGRAWIGIELSQEYCDIARKRIGKEATQMKLTF